MTGCFGEDADKAETKAQCSRSALNLDMAQNDQVQSHVRVGASRKPLTLDLQFVGALGAAVVSGAPLGDAQSGHSARCG